jgi:cytidine deaminase
MARAAARRAYAPYSRFRVGAAVLASDGSVYLGSNVENSSFGATVCAERVALGAAITHGRRRGLRAIALYAIAGDKRFTSSNLVPCGICLQWLAELAPNAKVVVCTGRRTIVYSVGELLASPFLKQ